MSSDVRNRQAKLKYRIKNYNSKVEEIQSECSHPFSFQYKTIFTTSIWKATSFRYKLQFWFQINQLCRRDCDINKYERLVFIFCQSIRINNQSSLCMCSSSELAAWKATLSFFLSSIEQQTRLNLGTYMRRYTDWEQHLEGAYLNW